jgi:transitional endoplasmic reticulum ATPase
MLRWGTRNASRNESQFKTDSECGSDGLEEIHGFLLQAVRRLVGRHETNSALLALILSLVGADERRPLVEAVARAAGVRPRPSRCNRKARPEDRVPEDLRELVEALSRKGGDRLLLEPLTEEFELHYLHLERRPPPGISLGQVGNMIERELDLAEDSDKAEAAVEQVLARFLDEALQHTAEPSNPPRLAEFVEAFGLPNVDRLVLLFFLARAGNRSFGLFCDAHSLQDWSRLLATACGTTTSQVQEALAEEGPLMVNGILTRSREDRASIYRLADPVVDYLTGLGGKPLADHFVRVDREPTFAIDSFPVTEAELEVLQRLVANGRPCHILVHGRAGTGKTEFVRALVAAAGKTLCFVQTGEEGTARQRRVALAGGSRLARPEDAALVVDEADTLLNTDGHLLGPGVDKGWLNTFMDRSPAIVIWISNAVGGIPSSVRRRFTYTLAFKAFNRAQRLSMWDQVLEGSSLGKAVDREMRRRLAAAFNVDASGIAGAVQAAELVLPSGRGRPEVVEETLGKLLRRHLEFMSGAPLKEPVRNVDEYRPDALRISGDRKVIVDALHQAVAARARGNADPRVNLLFWGPPGTGKTEFARYLAATLGLQLVVKTASELLSMWVGGTEKNIRAAFEEAEREEAILFIDEADSFFIDRSTAHRSWEVTQTNELLQRMEQHKGILICCTNFLHGLDRAALRRFDWKVEFKTLDEERLLTTYREYFALGRPELSPGQRRRLAALEGATFGDFRAIQGRIRFIPLEETDHDQLIDGLEEEIAYRKGDGGGRRLGFR